MSEFAPVRTLADLDSLSHEEIYEGYRDGLGGEPEPGNNRSRSYWHGWRNGHNDINSRSDEHQIALIKDMKVHGYFQRQNA